MKGNCTLGNAILKEMASPRTNYDILNDIDIPEFEIQQLDIDIPEFEIQQLDIAPAPMLEAGESGSNRHKPRKRPCWP